MKRSFLILPVIFIVAACGSHKVNADSPQTKAAVSETDALINKCVTKNPLALRTKAGRHAAGVCAFPPQNRTRGTQCLLHVVTSGVPTKARLKAGADACVLKWA